MSYKKPNEETLIFYSYSTKDKIEVQKIKRRLIFFGFKGFLAHEDIRVSSEWQDEIIKNLQECQIFIPFITNDFKKSDWADQECGIAYAENKLIIPLSVDLLPYGFLGKYQGLKYDSSQLADIIFQIVDAISNGNISHLKENLIYNLSISNNYEQSGNIAHMLTKFSEFTKDEINFIVESSIKNDQIHGSYTARPALRKILEKHIDIFDGKNGEKLYRILES